MAIGCSEEPRQRSTLSISQMTLILARRLIGCSSLKLFQSIKFQDSTYLNGEYLHCVHPPWLFVIFACDIDLIIRIIFSRCDSYE